ncbi:type II toxin-antitoxin system death-on-curing family toxin [Virgibacillus necropolis]|uniref:Type II toxin-antitoxin system death-on-curing family toxin n=1 Tax=Virgibacillus necropolis TaxID=163877 RepID=A0A221MGI7_9BACI|nr:type II toxin-antitoxin system death-on-curing family toxin [Virgibacillus necropolis]ASN06778.1 type II toxin-antitoxin system death-on-curing family toxin [Virgibacillus necropolis]
MKKSNESIIYLTTNQVIAINTLQINIYSPKEQVGVKEPGLLDSALNRPKQTIFGDDAYPTVYEKAAALVESLSMNHTFFNANKRTALASLIIFLKLNNYKWIMDVEKEQDFLVDIVNHAYSFQQIVSLIREHIIEG